MMANMESDPVVRVIKRFYWVSFTIALVAGTLILAFN